MQAAKIEADQLELYKCYSSKSTQERAAELPIDLSGMWKYHGREKTTNYRHITRYLYTKFLMITVKEPLSCLFEYCAKGDRKLFFR